MMSFNTFLAEVNDNMVDVSSAKDLSGRSPAKVFKNNLDANASDDAFGVYLDKLDDAEKAKLDQENKERMHDERKKAIHRAAVRKIHDIKSKERQEKNEKNKETVKKFGSDLGNATLGGIQFGKEIGEPLGRAVGIVAGTVIGGSVGAGAVIAYNGAKLAGHGVVAASKGLAGLPKAAKKSTIRGTEYLKSLASKKDHVDMKIQPK